MSSDFQDFSFPLQAQQLSGYCFLEFSDVVSYQYYVAAHDHAEILCDIQADTDVQITIICHEAAQLLIRCLIVQNYQSKLQFKILLQGRKSRVDMYGMSLLDGSQAVAITTQQIHDAQETESHVQWYTIVQDQARFEYCGTIRIEKDASKSYALQKNKNLLLSKQATAISVPNIEVLHHDVQCYHGAATGTFDQEQLIYLQSRGLSERASKKIIVTAFSAPFLQGYTNKETIMQRIEEVMR